MSLFYTNFTLRGPPAERVRAVLRSAARDAFIATADGTTVVCDRMADAFDTVEVEALSRVLSSQLRTPVLTVINHEDRVLLCLLHAGSQLIFQYTSDGSYFRSGEPGPHGDDPELLAKAFRREDAVDAVRRALGLDAGPEADPDADAAAGAAVLSAAERHAALCDALDMPRLAVGAGYDYIAERDLPAHLAPTDFHRV